MPPQLYGRDLRSGDILLQVNTGTMTHQVIRFGQKLMGRGNEEIIHAGIMFDNRFIIESAGRGIAANDIYLQDKPYAFQVYRCQNADLARGAGTCAKMFMDMHKNSGAMKYNAEGALGSIFSKPGAPRTREQMDQAFDRMIKGLSHPFFCSQFVVFVYQFAAEQSGIVAGKLFPFADACVPPSVLATSLKTHPQFRETGYLMENQR
ncbi:MAG TPA: hypothetical protein VGF96_06000 [Terracidiphilus sp.]|jgi:hypothetical protein